MYWEARKIRNKFIKKKFNTNDDSNNMKMYLHNYF